MEIGGKPDTFLQKWQERLLEQLPSLTGEQEKKTMEIGMVNNSLQQNLLPFLQCESDCLME
jgi:hypothetical protein